MDPVVYEGLLKRLSRQGYYTAKLNRTLQGGAAPE